MGSEHSIPDNTTTVSPTSPKSKAKLTAARDL